MLLTRPKWRGHITPWRPHREAQRLVKEAEGGRGKRGQEPLQCFTRKGMGEAGKAGSGLASLNTFSGFYSTEAAPSCLVLGVIRAEG